SKSFPVGYEPATEEMIRDLHLSCFRASCPSTIASMSAALAGLIQNESFTFLQFVHTRIHRAHTFHRTQDFVVEGECSLGHDISCKLSLNAAPCGPAVLRAKVFVVQEQVHGGR